MMQPNFEKMELIPAIVQDEAGQVLMLAYMNKEAFEKTLQSGLATYWSRSRNELWTKGESSGHYQHVLDIKIDCDRDALLLRVRQDGAACHTGHYSCFYRDLNSDEPDQQE